MAIAVNTIHSNTEDSTTVRSYRKMNHIANMFSGKFMIVPMNVSLIASVHAFLLLEVIHLTNQTSLFVLARLVYLTSSSLLHKTCQLY